MSLSTFEANPHVNRGKDMLLGDLLQEIEKGGLTIYPKTVRIIRVVDGADTRVRVTRHMWLRQGDVVEFVAEERDQNRRKRIWPVKSE